MEKMSTVKKSKTKCRKRKISNGKIAEKGKTSKSEDENKNILYIYIFVRDKTVTVHNYRSFMFI